MLWSRWEVITLVRGACVLGKTAWCTTQGKYKIILFSLPSNSSLVLVIPLYVLNALLSNSGIFPIPTLFL